jgi:hypothetical protein
MVITGINTALILLKRKKNLKLEEHPKESSQSPF